MQHQEKNLIYFLLEYLKAIKYEEAIYVMSMLNFFILICKPLNYCLLPLMINIEQIHGLLLNIIFHLSELALLIEKYIFLSYFSKWFPSKKKYISLIDDIEHLYYIFSLYNLNIAQVSFQTKEDKQLLNQFLFCQDMIQVQNDIEALNKNNKQQFDQIKLLFNQLKLSNDYYRVIITNSSEENQANLFQKKITKNLHSLLLSYLSFRDIMRLKLVNQYNRDLVLFQYPDLIQRCQKKLAQLKEQQQNLAIDQQQVEQITANLHQLNKSQLTEFCSFKNPHKLIEEVQIALYQLLNNTVKADYQNHVKPYLKSNQNQILNSIQQIDVKNIKEPVLYSIKTILSEENQAQILGISQAANGIFRYIQNCHNIKYQEKQNKWKITSKYCQRQRNEWDFT
ncbi:hypothetical protein pb186bvf_019741 [Paramecium bursaria]